MYMLLLMSFIGGFAGGAGGLLASFGLFSWWVARTDKKEEQRSVHDRRNVQ